MKNNGLGDKMSMWYVVFKFKKENPLKIGTASFIFKTNKKKISLSKLTDEIKEKEKADEVVILNLIKLDGDIEI